jgi:uncharacterized membrane protein (UPF0182 family)
MMAFAWFNRFTNNQNTAYVIVRMILSTTLIYESPEGFEIQDSKFEIRNSPFCLFLPIYRLDFGIVQIFLLFHFIIKIFS